MKDGALIVFTGDKGGVDKSTLAVLMTEWLPTAFPEACAPWHTCQPYSTPSGGACPDRPAPRSTLRRRTPAGASAVGEVGPPVGAAGVLQGSAAKAPAQNAFWNSYPSMELRPR